MSEKNETTAVEESVIPANAVFSSVPKPVKSDTTEWPEQLDGEDIWSKGTWSGLDQWTCLWQVKHLKDGGVYKLPCRQQFWSYEELMDHIRDSH